MKTDFKKRVLFLNQYIPSKNLHENMEFLINEQNSGKNISNGDISSYVKKPNILDFKPLSTNNLPLVNLYNTEKPKAPTRELSVAPEGYKGPFKYSYKRYEGEMSTNRDGYTTYNFDSKKLPEWEKIFQNDLKKWGRDNSTLEKLEKEQINYLPWVSFASYFFGPYGKAFSLGLDLYIANLYWNKNQKYEAGLYLALSVIPFGTLANKIPTVKKYGTKVLKSLSSKIGNPSKMTTQEKEVYFEIIKNNKWILSEASKTLFKKIISQAFKKLSLRTIVRFMWIVTKRYPKSYFILKEGLKFGGVWYSYDKLYNIFFISKDEKKIKELEKIFSDDDTLREKPEEVLIKLFDVLSEEERIDIYNKSLEELYK